MMENQFFEQPVLSSPYDYPLQPWELAPLRSADPENRSQPPLDRFRHTHPQAVVMIKRYALQNEAHIQAAMDKLDARYRDAAP